MRLAVSSSLSLSARFEMTGPDQMPGEIQDLHADTIIVILQYSGAPVLLREVCKHWKELANGDIQLRRMSVLHITSSIPLLKWGVSHGCCWNSRICAAAAANGAMEVLRWAWDQGCEWDATTCTAAARRGDLEMLRWVRARGCPWNESTCSYAAAVGRLDMLAWARQNGCPWDSSTLEHARVNGHSHVVEWAKENGCPPEQEDWAW